MEKPPCTIGRCAKPSVARGMCGMHYRRWRLYGEQSGENRTVIELDVDDIGPTLRFAMAKVTKSQRGGSGNGGGQSGGNWGSNGQQGGVQRSGGHGQRLPQDDPWGASGGRGGYDEAPPF